MREDKAKIISKKRSMISHSLESVVYASIDKVLFKKLNLVHLEFHLSLYTL